MKTVGQERDLLKKWLVHSKFQLSSLKNAANAVHVFSIFRRQRQAEEAARIRQAQERELAVCLLIASYLLSPWGL